MRLEDQERGLKLLGAASVIAASAWFIANSPAECLLKYRPVRYAANDAGVLKVE